ncbi:hypothetical protein SC1_03434 [Sphingopyxis sp. C-1]|nr:hypothetical protein SC1_03434 [Sphingopyxis sp. C-1]
MVARIFDDIRKCPRCKVGARVATILLQCKAGLGEWRASPQPPAPSLSKGRSFFKGRKSEERCFDKLGTNGRGGGAWAR